jgi:hypothetical protein
MITLVFLLEEKSAKELLRQFIPRIFPDIYVEYLVFEGKQDLEKNIYRKINGWLKPNTRFIILRDQDSGDCHLIKQNLISKVPANRHAYTLVRIACKELESWIIGDWPAVATAFGNQSLPSSGIRRYNSVKKHLHISVKDLILVIMGDSMSTEHQEQVSEKINKISLLQEAIAAATLRNQTFDRKSQVGVPLNPRYMTRERDSHVDRYSYSYDVQVQP